MRTTVTLDEDTERLVRDRMRERGVSFEQAINDSIREGNVGRPTEPATRTFSLGTAPLILDRALQVAADLEDEEFVDRTRRNA